MAQLAFLGLGVMGAPMAGHWARAGHDVRVWNRSPDKASAHAQAHGTLAAATIDEAVSGAQAVAVCVGDDPDAEAVAQTAMAAMDRGALYIEHTTASAELARRLDALASAHGLLWLDAPVSGGEAGAVNGQLTIMCGGSAAAFAAAQPIMTPYAKAMTHMGEAGAGQLAKMVNQICIAGVLQGLAEGVHFAQAAGLDPETVFSAISKGAAGSWQMENRAGTMAQDRFDFGFAVDWMRKDLRITLEEARRNGARLSLTALVDQYYADIQAMGGGRWDTSSLLRRLT